MVEIHIHQLVCRARCTPTRQKQSKENPLKTRYLEDHLIVFEDSFDGVAFIHICDFVFRFIHKLISQWFTNYEQG